MNAAPWSKGSSVVFAVTVAAIALVPWTVVHWPSQDGQNHLAVAHVLMHYGDPGSPFPEYVTTQTGLRPSTALYQFLRVAGRFMSLQTAEKIIVSLALVLLPSSLLLFVRRALPRRAENAMLGLPFVTGWAFAMGFLNFQMALALGVTTLALAWDGARGAGEAQPIGWRHVLASSLYFLCVWFHPVAALVTGLALVLLEWRNLLRREAWGRVVVVVGPAALFLVGAWVASGAGPETSAAHTGTSFADWATVLGAAFEFNVAYTPLELAPRFAALSILVPFAVRGIRADPPQGVSPEAAVGRLVLVFLALYAVTPSSLLGWGYASARFFLYAWLLLPAVAEIPAWIGRRLVVLGPALAMAVIAIQWPFIHHASRQMQDVVDAAVSLPRGSKLVPMDFTASVLGPQPLGHAWAELVVERDAVASQLFAAGKPRMGGERFRTLSFRPGLLDPATGKLPWSTNETWHDVRRRCAEPGSPIRWFVNVPGDCAGLLAARKADLEVVIDRYDDVLMLDPPPYGRDLIASHLRLVSHVGTAWLYAVQHEADGANRAR
jgi:hypothetical protein